MGVDMIGMIVPALPADRCARTSRQPKVGGLTVNLLRKGDTIYVECTSQCKAYQGRPDLLYRRDGTDASRESGTFYTRVSSPTILEPMPKLVSYVLKYSLTKVIKERLLMLIRKVLQPVSTV